MMRSLALKTAWLVIVAMVACLFVVPQTTSCSAGGELVVGGACGSEMLRAHTTWQTVDEHLAVSVRKLLLLAVVGAVVPLMFSRGLGTPSRLLTVRLWMSQRIRSGPAAYRVPLPFTMLCHGG